MLQSPLEGLNDAQIKAVTHTTQHLLVLAGAGSGKTRVITHRIAWLIKERSVLPSDILAVTFTNKAANEMKMRLASLINTPITNMWVGTFHSLALRILRLYPEKAGLTPDFQVMDALDQKRLIKRFAEDLNIQSENVSTLVKGINYYKDQGITSENAPRRNDYERHLADIYQQYTKTCQQSSLVDFADLLLKSYQVLNNNSEIQQIFHERFKHILIDEYQDTNHIQYLWLSALACKTASLVAVGDDDQMIYSWRGALIENIRDFTTRFNKAEVVKLEQNYRSSGNILHAANSVIQSNKERLGKELWTDQSQGEDITIYRAYSEHDEAQYIVGIIKQRTEKVFANAAILYRTNAQSRVLEKALLSANIPYRIHGATGFYERAEVKNVLAYLRLTMLHNDDASLDRVINVPPRGIGATTMARIRKHAQDNNCSLWHAIEQLCSIEKEGLSERSQAKCLVFLRMILKMRQQIEGLEIVEQVKTIIEISGLTAHYTKEKGEIARNRLDNITELINAASEFSVEEETDNSLQDFLVDTALESKDTGATLGQDAVQLMTIHKAKGLEFPLVFVAGAEEEVFGDSQEHNDEECRLLYVAITRAMKKLYICYAEMRTVYGREQRHNPLRFLHDIPSEIVDAVRVYEEPYLPKRNIAISNATFKLGSRVCHGKFGEGIVTDAEGQGADERVQVEFERVGAKWLVLEYANLEVV